MNIKSVRQIVEMMKQADLSEFELEEENFRLRISRGSANNAAPAQIIQQIPSAAPAQPAPAAPTTATTEAVKEDLGPVIKSPMVGTFYSSPSPDSDPFVAVGTKVSGATTVCIVEAMKVMNEIQAEVDGTITEVLVENGQSVEYGQPLFRISKG